MNDPISEAELLQRLQAAEHGGGTSDATIQGFLDELDTLAVRLQPVANSRKPAVEPELAAILEQLARLADPPPPGEGIADAEPGRSGGGSSPGRLDAGPADHPQGAVSPSSPLAKPVLLGQYELISELGSGGMGSVYKARHTRLDRLVALKVLRPRQIPSPQALSRFSREMRAVGKLSHPHIVAAHDAGEIEGTQFLVMELVDGCDLGKLVKQMGRLRIADACELMRQAALGLQHIADQGMVHRDIKPMNLMLSRAGRPGEPAQLKILDLGLTLFPGSSVGTVNDLTETGQVIGTVDYMAPEQGLESPHDLDIRADLYSLGATLFKLLTGRAPFEAPQYNTMLKRLRALDREIPPTVASLRSDCPAALSDLVARLLAKAPEARPASPEQVARALKPFAAGANLEQLLDRFDRSLLDESSPQRPQYSEMATAPTQVMGARHPVTERRRQGGWKAAGLLAALSLLALLAVLLIQTRDGTLQIEAPDDLIGQVSVSIREVGAPAGTSFEIRPGTTSHRVRAGRVEVQLPTDLADQFEFLPAGELVVRRNQQTTVTLRRKSGAIPTANDPETTTQIPARAVDAPPRVSEEPPLEDWLRGRERLTVSQDGRGQFKTIQAALDALEPGQVVQVLDRGPYQERLQVDFLPRDTGLISTVGTVISAPDWLYLYDYREAGQAPIPVSGGHVLARADGFRLHGFEMHFADSDLQIRCRIVARACRRLTLENCIIHSRDHYGGEELDLANYEDASSSGMHVTVRSCVIEGSLRVSSWVGNSTAAIEKNYFVNRKNQHFLMLVGPRLMSARVRENIFVADDAPTDAIAVTNTRQMQSLEITNNTIASRIAIAFVDDLPAGAVTIRNNLHDDLRGVFIQTSNAIPAQRSEIAARWQIDHNVTAQPDHGDNPVVVPLQPGDTSARPRFLSRMASDRDFLRPPANDRLASAGAGGVWLPYRGALPPGPQPETGDWFSALRRGLGPAALRQTSDPSAIAPLEEWLPGRKILTVARDASGQFKTIQAALDAVQPGQAIQILDQGPYREALTMTEVSDVALFSRAKTIIELPGWRPRYKEQVGHLLTGTSRVRWHGLSFVFPDDEGTFGCLVENPNGFLLEHCQFRCRARHPDLGRMMAGLAVLVQGEPPCTVPIVIRNCDLRDGMMMNVDNPAADCLIEHNYFHGHARAQHVAMGAVRARSIIIRQNVYADEVDYGDLAINDARQIDLLEISNNTFTSASPMVFGGTANPGRTVIVNNLHTRSALAGFVFGAENVMPSELTNWQHGHNVFAEPVPLSSRWGRDWKLLPEAPTDRQARPRFLSRAPGHRDQFRLAADDPVGHAGHGGDFPDYVGALPPGPAPADGDWFTRIREAWHGLPSTTLPAQWADAIPTTEPASLDEWLQGRTVLTVARDGSAQFKTIQEAVSALQPGQVVKVLDQGPYEERLAVSPPDNTGLITLCGTVVRMTGWHSELSVGAWGHSFRNARNFRIHGFDFEMSVQPPPDGHAGYLVEVSQPSQIVVENCIFRQAKPGDLTRVVRCFWHQEAPTVGAVFRHCVFEGNVTFNSSNPLARVQFEQNYFPDHHDVCDLWVGDSYYDQVLIRHNVFPGRTDGYDILFHFSNADAQILELEVSNNTLLSPFAVGFHGNVPLGRVRLCNNLRLLPGLVRMFDGAQNERPRLEAAWTVRNNACPRQRTAGEFAITEDEIFPLFATDLRTTPRFLAMDPENRDYLRLEPDQPAARYGVGGTWPDYTGALPPGSAPAEGDWLTRLIDRRNAVRPKIEP